MMVRSTAYSCIHYAKEEHLYLLAFIRSEDLAALYRPL